MARSNISMAMTSRGCAGWWLVRAPLPPGSALALTLGGALLLAGCAELLGEIELPATESVVSPLQASPGAAGAAPEGTAEGTQPGAPALPVSESPGGEAPNPSDFQVDLSGSVPCAPDSVRCLEDVRQSCVADGSGWLALEACAGSSLCTPERCLQPSCAAHELRCDGRELQQCNAGRDGWLLIATCATPAHCDPSGANPAAIQCAPEPCAAGAQRCNGARLERCLADRSGWELIVACESGDLCTATLAEGAERCAPPVCDARELRCQGRHLQRCNAGRSGWVSLEHCSSEALCEASQEAGSPRCTPAGCAPGQHVCDGPVLSTCEPELTGFQPKASCLETELCDPVRGRCGARECSAGERRCNGAQIELCNPEQTGFAATADPPCATPELCRAAPGEGPSCAPPLCAVGEFRCAGNLLQRCSDGRSAWQDFATCASAELCNAERGASGCVPQDCQPGERRCLGDTLTLCRPGGDGSDAIAQCATAGGCDPEALECRDPCVVGSTRCRAEQLQTCSDPLRGWESTACASAELCDAASGRCQPPACAAGQRRCAGASVEECSPGLTGFVPVEQCASAALCTQSSAQGTQSGDQGSQGGDQATCQPPACAAGETRCDDDDLLTCNAARTGFSVESCDGLLNTCVAGPPARCRR